MQRFIGTYKCAGCLKKRVRVYDWLPDAPLCAACQKREFEHVEDDDDDDDDEDDDSLVAALRATLRAIDAADEYLREHGETDPDSELSHVDDFGHCTTTAEYVAQKHGGEVFGYAAEDDDDERVGASTGGHDFALIDGRYIVDWWAKSYESEPRDIVDLQDPEQRAYALEKYGDRSGWSLVRSEPLTRPRRR